MTEKQAIHCMKFNCELVVCEECDLYGTVGTDHCFKDACREAINALEKQIPKEPIITMEYTKCPKCEYPFYFGCNDNYCVSCGQAIKWE